MRVIEFKMKRTGFMAAVALFAVAASVPATLALAPVAHATGSTTNYSACSDSYVDDLLPTTNFGSSTSLYTNEGDPAYQNTLIKFCNISVPSNVHVSSATLTFYLEDGTGGQENGMVIRRLPRSSSWTETGVTWNNQPAPYGAYSKRVTYTGPYFAYSTQTFDVTQQVQMTNTTGDYAWQLAATDGYVNYAQVYINSREASSHTPVLTVTTADDTAPTITSPFANWLSGQVPGEDVGATINPNGSLTHAIAQIADDSAFTTNVVCSPTCTLSSGDNIGQQPLDVAFDQEFLQSTLITGHTYYARVVAQNYKGTTYSSTVTFTAP